MDEIASWIPRLQKGDPQAERVIWDTFYERLVRLARQRLRNLPHAAADEEDMAISALGNFYRGLSVRKFPRMSNFDEVWKVLATLTIRETISYARRELAAKRGGRHWRQAPLTEADHDPEQDHSGLHRSEPAAACVASAGESCNDLLAKLEDDTLREVANRKLEGYSNAEIAQFLGCTVRTVERKLARIREVWG